MLDFFALKVINLLLEANPNTKHQLSSLATKVIKLNLPFVGVQFIIASDGSLESEFSNADCTITIPLASVSYVLHHDELKTYKQLDVEGDKNLAKKLLEILATIEVTKVLYLSQNPLINIFANQLEKILLSLVNYAKVMSNNAGHSFSQYMQYEINEVVDRHDLDKFISEVDEVKAHYERLLKQVERIKN